MVGPRDIRTIRTDSLVSVGTPAAGDEVLIRDVTDNVVKHITLSSLNANIDHGSLSGLADFTADHGTEHDAHDHSTALGTATTTDLAEGTNLYYTDARVNADIDARVTKAFVDALNVDADTLDGIDSTGFSLSGHVHDAADVTTGQFANARISQASVTQHQAALTITESQISDLDHLTIEEVQDNLGGGFLVAGTNLSGSYNDVANTYTFNVTGVAQSGHTHTESDVTDLDHLTIEEVQDNLGTSFIVGGTNITVVYDDVANTLTFNKDALVAGDIPNLDASKITTGTFADARISQSSVTQHQAALSITESQISNLDHLTIEEVQDNLGTLFLQAGTDISVSYDDVANTFTINSTATGVTDHGNLTGLADDDHTQYFNSTRHDAHDHSTALGTAVISDLSDVTLGALVNDDILAWNGTVWTNQSAADAGLATSGHGHSNYLLNTTDTLTGSLTVTSIIDGNEFHGDNGGVTDPTYTFRLDQDTGFYYGGSFANYFSITTGSIETFGIGRSGNESLLYLRDANSAIGYNSNGSTFRVFINGTNEMVLSAGTANFQDSDVIGTGQFRAGTGSAATPGITFDADPDLGFYREGPNALAVTAGNNTALRISSASCRFEAASTGEPNGFLIDTDTGFRQAGTNAFEIVRAGNRGLYVASTIITGIGDGTHQLGNGSNRFGQIYSTSSSISTSDPSMKKDMRRLGKREGLDFINSLEPIEYKWKDGKRPHRGLNAEQVGQVLKKKGIDHAAFIDPSKMSDEELERDLKVELAERYEIATETERQEKAEKIKGMPKGLRYEEFIADLVAAVQALSDEVDSLKEELSRRP